MIGNGADEPDVARIFCDIQKANSTLWVPSGEKKKRLRIMHRNPRAQASKMCNLKTDFDVASLHLASKRMARVRGEIILVILVAIV